MRILFTAMADSVHTARWIGQLRGAGWDLHLFPDRWPCAIHPDLDGVTLHGVGLWRPPGLRPGVRVAGLWPFARGGCRVEQWVRRRRPWPADRAAELARTIRRLRPDLVHTLEMQRAGYLTLAARGRLGARFPTWMYSCWGNDVYYFGRQPEHAARVRAVLAACDVFVADCERDLRLAGEYGFRGVLRGPFPTGGGYEVEALQRWRLPGPSAPRRAIAVKGYQNWGGRALLALQAIHRCAEAVRGYDIAVYSATADVAATARHVAAVTGLRVEALPPAPHEELLRLMGRARLALAVSVTDGTPNAMLEAMIMGALPIQSDTVSTREWIADGVNGLLVPPEDVGGMERALRRAVADDALVEGAAAHNAQLVRSRIDRAVIQPRVIEMYEKKGAQRCGYW